MLDLFCNPVPNHDPSRRIVAITIGACLFLPRKLWFELGGFPEWMGSIAEDMYLCCLARLHGLSVRVTSGSGYRHRQGASFGGSRLDAGKLHTTFRRRRLSERNKTAVMVICTPTLLVWLLLVVHIIELAVEGAALTLLKWDYRIWKEIYAPTFSYIAGELDRLRIVRKQVQHARRASMREYMSGVVLFPRKLSMLLRYGVPTVK
jgi:GT2 family glycosyltransferase